jgi:hypothetical protein
MVAERRGTFPAPFAFALGKAELRPAKNVCRLSDKILPNRCPRQPLVKVNRR